MPEIRTEVENSRRRHGKDTAGALRWKVTLNRYPVATAAASNREVGFPWHRDLIANGAGTLILNLGATGKLEFGEDQADAPIDGINYSSDHKVAPGKASTVPVLERLDLEDGDLLVMVGPARWDTLHRVVPTVRDSERISLVFGAW